MKKTEGLKSRDTVPLITLFNSHAYDEGSVANPDLEKDTLLAGLIRIWIRIHVLYQSFKTITFLVRIIHIVEFYFSLYTIH
jgi:hypothetical protein